MNENVRAALKENGIYHWRLAELMGISEYTLSKRFRHELSEEDKKNIFRLIGEEVERRDAEQ